MSCHIMGPGIVRVDQPDGSVRFVGRRCAACGSARVEDPGRTWGVRGYDPTTGDWVALATCVDGPPGEPPPCYVATIARYPTRR